MWGDPKAELGTEITYGDMERPSSSSSSISSFSAAGGGKGEGSEGVDWWIVATGFDPIIPTIPGLHNPNVLYYVDFLRRHANIIDRITIDGVWGIRFDAKR